MFRLNAPVVIKALMMTEAFIRALMTIGACSQNISKLFAKLNLGTNNLLFIRRKVRNELEDGKASSKSTDEKNLMGD